MGFISKSLFSNKSKQSDTHTHTHSLSPSFDFFLPHKQKSLQKLAFKCFFFFLTKNPISLKPQIFFFLPISMEEVLFTFQMGNFWHQTRAPLIAPFLKLFVSVCLVMSLMLLFERVYMGIVILFVKLFRKNPHKTYKWEPIKDDLELSHFAYPMVLVQIPMYNEKEVKIIKFIETH